MDQNYENAIQGGWEQGGTPKIPVCRVAVDGRTIPGKLVDNRCNYGYDGRELISDIYKVLTDDGKPYSWESINKHKPINWIRFFGGTTEGREVFVCRTKHKKSGFFERGMHPGVLFGKECRYVYGGNVHVAHESANGGLSALTTSNFDVLYITRQS